MRISIALLLGIAALHAADLVTTWVALGHGAVEANPLMAWLLERAGMVGLVFAKVAVAGACIGLAWTAEEWNAGDTLPQTGVMLCAVIMLFVVASNSLVVVAARA